MMWHWRKGLHVAGSIAISKQENLCLLKICAKLEFSTLWQVWRWSRHYFRHYRRAFSPSPPPLPQAAPALNFNHGRKKVWSERERRGISDYHRAKHLINLHKIHFATLWLSCWSPGVDPEQIPPQIVDNCQFWWNNFSLKVATLPTPVPQKFIQSLEAVAKIAKWTYLAVGVVWWSASRASK